MMWAFPKILLWLAVIMCTCIMALRTATIAWIILFTRGREGWVFLAIYGSVTALGAFMIWATSPIMITLLHP